MPAVLSADRLGIECVFSDGSTARFDLDDLPCPDLAGDLLVGLAELIHPHGAVDAAGSVNHYAQSIRDLTRTLGGRGVPRRGRGPAPGVLRASDEAIVALLRACPSGA